MLGISYDLDNWTWKLSDDKLTPLVRMLAMVACNGEVCNGDMMSLNGRLNHYMHLVPDGCWQRGFLLRLQDSAAPHSLKFNVTPEARLQAQWWLSHIRAASEKSAILDPMEHHRMNPVQVYSDAAGGSLTDIKNGAGGFSPPETWVYVPWPSIIRENRANSDGVKFAHKLCSLEGFAALLGLVAVPDKTRNREVNIYCDNAGFVAVYKKKHSKCPYSYTLAKAIHDVGKGFGCKVNVLKTRRCSGTGEEAADALSKGDWDRAWANMPGKDVDPVRVPVTLLQWIGNPKVDLNLGKKVLCDMLNYTKVLHLKGIK